MNTLKRLDELLEEREMTLWQLSKVSGLSYNSLKYMKTKGSELSVSAIEQICKAIDLPLAEFFAEASTTQG